MLPPGETVAVQAAALKAQLLTPEALEALWAEVESGEMGYMPSWALRLQLVHTDHFCRAQVDALCANGSLCKSERCARTPFTLRRVRVNVLRA